MRVTVTGTTRFALATTALTTAGIGYAAGYEARAYRLRQFQVPVLPPGSPEIRLLHISDLHLLPRHRKAVRFLRGLAALEPDLVVSTGDHIAHPASVATVAEALEPLLARPGVFVFGSNDYYAPRPKNPARYLTRDHARPTHGTPLPAQALRETLAARGWIYLGNARARLRVRGVDVALVGVDDPHIHRDRWDAVSPAEHEPAGLRIGVTHAPYRRVLDAMVADGARLLLAGHTHGGQLCLPGYGALVTNCDLPRSQASGLSRYPASSRGGSRDAAPSAYLHVSAGLGTSPYAPVRFACPPEASLLRLVAR